MGGLVPIAVTWFQWRLQNRTVISYWEGYQSIMITPYLHIYVYVCMSTLIKSEWPKPRHEFRKYTAAATWLRRQREQWTRCLYSNRRFLLLEIGKWARETYESCQRDRVGVSECWICIYYQPWHSCRAPGGGICMVKTVFWPHARAKAPSSTPEWFFNPSGIFLARPRKGITGNGW